MDQLFPKSQSLKDLPQCNSFIFKSNSLNNCFLSPKTLSKPNKIQMTTPRNRLIPKKTLQVEKDNNSEECPFKMIPLTSNKNEIIDVNIENNFKPEELNNKLLHSDGNKENDERNNEASSEELLRIKSLEMEIMQLKVKIHEQMNNKNNDFQEYYFKHSTQMLNNLQSSNQFIIQISLNLQREMDEMRNAIKDLTQILINSMQVQLHEKEQKTNSVNVVEKSATDFIGTAINVDSGATVHKQKLVENINAFSTKKIVPNDLKILKNAEVNKNNLLINTVESEINKSDILDETIKNLTQQIIDRKAFISKELLREPKLVEIEPESAGQFQFPVNNSMIQKSGLSRFENGPALSQIKQNIEDDDNKTLGTGTKSEINENKIAPNKWACEFCTFVNHKKFWTCKICRKSKKQKPGELLIEICDQESDSPESFSIDADSSIDSETASGSTIWSCKSCTFRNTLNTVSCDVCCCLRNPTTTIVENNPLDHLIL